MYKFGDILLLSFPFTNAVNAKKRPALVIADTNDNDLILARITTQLYETEYDVTIDNWNSAGLLTPSVVRLHKIATIENTLIDRQIGTLFDSDLKKVFNTIFAIVDNQKSNFI